MNSIKNTARFAGLLYFLQIPLGVFGLLYFPKGLYVAGNIVKTTANILSNEFLFRLSIVSSIVCALVTVATALVLYQVLKPVNKYYAKMIVVFALLAAPISMLNELNKVAILLLAKSPNYATAFTSEQGQTLLSLFLDLHQYGMHIVGIFFGLWLLPMAYLVIVSTYIPKIIGFLLMITCVGYLVDFTTFFLYPNFGLVVGEYTWIGEVVMVFWLLIKGVNTDKYTKLNIESITN